MSDDVSDLDRLQETYRTAVEAWIAGIRREAELACVNHSVAEVDEWEGASFAEEELRNKAKAAKEEYESALREKFFGF